MSIANDRTNIMAARLGVCNRDDVSHTVFGRIVDKGRFGEACDESALVRRDSEFGLLRDIEKRTQIFGDLFSGLLGAIPSASTHKVPHLIVLLGFSWLSLFMVLG